MSADAVQAAVSQRFTGTDTGANAANAVDTSSPGPNHNEFVIFSKPELGRLQGAELDKVWDLFADAFAAHRVSVHQTTIVTGAELDASGAMAQHYGVINDISRRGRPALTAAAEGALTDTFADSMDTAEVLGGHQFLERFGEFNPFSLAMLFSNAGVSRLGPGTYGCLVTIDGATVIILNGFHPRQLSFFTAEDTVVAFLHGSSSTDWETLRAELIGTTDPAKAKPTSVRGAIFADPSAFGLSSVNSNFNGVHMSAGPLEGLVELDRFFGDLQPVTDWSFAQALSAAGASGEDITALLANPVLELNGERGTAFDLTEGMNAKTAAPLLG